MSNIRTPIRKIGGGTDYRDIEVGKAIWPSIGLLLFTVLFTVSLNFLNFRTGDIEFFDSDATWHTLLTIEAYQETPVAIHKFLPIVSLGNPSDKGIPWGATIPDGYGNYYYTSFSPAGYFLPYFFMKLLGLGVNRPSLYMFNTLLLVLSSCILAAFTSSVFKNSRYRWRLAVLAVLLYTMEPEIMHGLGLVYWHQGVMQVTLLLQIYCYWLYRNKRSGKARPAFYCLCVLNPYIEWTGYVANAGFVLSELFLDWENRKSAFRNAAIIGTLTVVGFLLFSLHYVSVVSAKAFFHALKARFLARNFAASVSAVLLLKGYGYSFRYLWVLLTVLIFMVFALYRNMKWHQESLLWNHKWLLFVLLFPVLENLIMKEHAIGYSYDRMKLIFPLCFICCDLMNLILIKAGKQMMVTVLAGMVCILNVYAYRTSNLYEWPTPYMHQNRVLADYLNAHYPKALYCTNTAVRGYINLTFGRGVYEGTRPDKVIPMAEKKGFNEIVYFEQDPNVPSVHPPGPTATAGITEWRAVRYSLPAKQARMIHVQQDGTVQDVELNE